MKKLITIFLLFAFANHAFAENNDTNKITLATQDYCLQLPEGNTCFELNPQSLLILYPSEFSREQVIHDLSGLSIFKPINDTDFINYPKGVTVNLATHDTNLLNFINQFNLTHQNYYASPLLNNKGMQHALYDVFFIKLKNNNLNLLKQYAIQFDFSYEESKLQSTYRCKLNNHQYNTFELSKFIQQKKVFEFVEPDFIYFCKSSTNDSAFPDQWWLQNTGQFSGTPGADMDVVNAWTLNTGSSTVSVGIIDCFGSLADFNHSDVSFDSMYDATGTGFFSTGFDGDAHGINCGGIVAATTNNNNGIAGIAYNSQIKAIKVGTISNSSGGWTSTGNSISDGIIWGYQNCSVLSNSNTFGSSSSLINNAIANSITLGRGGLGTPFLSSNGNSNSTTIGYPASNSNTIAVAASSMCDERKSYSSCDNVLWGSDYGTGTDVAAPGTMMLSTDIAGIDGYSFGDYYYFGGTSASCPAAAAVMALIISYQPSITYSNARYALESTCEKVGGYAYSTISGQPNGTWSNDLGYGRINAYSALQSLISSGTCSGTTVLNSCSGTISDGSGANNYADNLNCSWLIQVPGATSITLNFTNFNTEFNFDSVNIYDGSSSAAMIIGSYSGTSLPPVITSSTGNVFIEFVTNSSNTFAGWALNYTCNLPSSGCSGTTVLTACSGSFSDGSGASNYLNNVNCSWLIQVPGATSITLNFTNFDTELGYDFVKIYDGSSSSALQLLSHSGPNLPPSITSSTGSVFIEFETDGSITYSGWNISYTCNTISSSCSGTTVLTACSGSFSDGSGASNYLDNLNCSWLIQVPGASSITLNFINFNTELNFDSVTIYDGSSSAAMIIGSYSGTSLPPVITSSTGNVFIEFVTNSSNTFAGWALNYTCNLPSSGCSGTTVLTACSGSFSDGSGASNYLNNVNCSWLIQVPGATSITLNFTNFDTELGYDFVKIYDGSSSSALQLLSHSGPNLPPSITSSTGSVFIVFTTDISITYSGWDISYTCNTVSSSCSGTTVLTACSGSISDGSGASNYLDYLNCSWLIQVPSASSITLSFTNFETEYGYDYVRIYDGTSSSDPLIGAYSGNLAPFYVNSTSGNIFINFTSDYSIVDQGWDLTYTCCSVLAANAGPDINLDCLVTSSVIGSSAVAGYTYSWTPSIGLSATNVAQPTANPSITTSYTVTADNGAGCIQSDVVIVYVNNSPPFAFAGNDKFIGCTANAIIGSSAIAGYTYSWSPSIGLSSTTIAQPNANPITTTSYTVTVTNGGGCTATDVVVVNVNTSLPIANAGPNQNLNCLTTSVLIGTSGITGNTYSWSPASTLNWSFLDQPIASPTTTTTYTVIVTNAYGCTATDAVLVNVNATPAFADAGLDKYIGCNPTSAIIGTSAIAGNTYSWSPSIGLSSTTIAQPNANPVTTTSYTVTVTNGGGCAATDVVVVNVNTSLPIANAGPNQNLNCITTSVLIGTSGITGNTYSWSPSSTLNWSFLDQPIASPTATTTYTVIVTNAYGCTATDAVLVNVNATPAFADAGLDKYIGCNPTSSIIGTSAVAGYTYSWSPAIGLNSTTIAQPTANPVTTTSYTVTVTNGGGCAATDVVVVNVNTSLPIANAGPNQNLNCVTTSVLIGTSGIPGNTYSWSPASTLNWSFLDQPIASPTTTTTYTLIVTNAYGCTATDAVLVNVNATPAFADAGLDKYIGCNPTSAIIGTSAIAGNTYSWSPAVGLSSTTIAQPNASPASTTIYTLTVTNGGGCIATDVVVVNVNTSLPIANAGPNQNLNCITTSVLIGTIGIAGNTYSWSPASTLNWSFLDQPIASPTTTTTYTVIVTNAYGCTATDAVLVNVNATPAYADAGLDKYIGCNPTSSIIGTSTVGGNTYSWSPSIGLSSTTIAQPNANPVTTTSYTVTVTNGSGCVATDVVVVNVNTSSPVANAGPNQNLNCLTTSVLIGTSGILGNTYSWSPSSTLNWSFLDQPIASPTATTTYTVIVTNAYGCTATDAVLVNVNATPAYADAGLDKYIGCNPTSSIIGTGAIAGNTYSWSPSIGLSSTTIAQPNANPITTTSYTVTVTNGGGCTTTDVVVVNVNTSSPVANAGPDQNLNCLTTSVLIGTSGIPGNSYSWSPASTLNWSFLDQPIASPTTTTTYTVIVTNGYGCTATDAVLVNVNATPAYADAGLDKYIGCNPTSSIIGTSAIAGNTYSWSPSIGLNSTTIAQPNANPITTTSYTVTVTNGGGCVATDIVVVNVNTSSPVANAGPNQNLNCITTSVLIGTIGIAGNTYSWSPASTLNWSFLDQTIASPTATTTYTLIVTNAYGCTATDAVIVNVNATPAYADAGLDKYIGCNPTSSIIGTSTVGGNTYSWSPAVGLSSTTIAQPNANPITTTSYTVTVTNGGGCVATDVVVVNVNTSSPVANAGPNQNLNCLTTSVLIGTSGITGNTYSWSPASTLNWSFLDQPIASPTATTTYTVIVTNAYGCTATDAVLVNVNATPAFADAGFDKYIGCNPTSAIIGTSAIAGNTYSWSPAVGLSSTTIAQPNANPVTTTSYTVTVTNGGGCTATDVVVVNVNTSLPIANAGPDQNLNCLTTSVLIGTSGITGNTYSWSPASTLNWSFLDQPIASPTTTTTYTVIVTNAYGCTATDAVLVNVNATPAFADAGFDKFIGCNPTSAIIGTSTVAGNTYSWSPSIGLSSTTIAQPNANPVTTTSYTVTVTNGGGCVATDVVVVNVNTSLPIANAGPDQNLNCITTSMLIGTSGITGNTYSWSPTSSLNNPIFAQPTASPTSTTSYTVTVTGTNGCTSSDVALVNVNITSPIANAGPDTVVSTANPSANIGAPPIAGYTYSWSPINYLNSSTISNPVANPPITTTYTLTVTDTNDCIGVDVVTVHFKLPQQNVDLSDEEGPGVYPNPIGDELYIDNVKEVMSYTLLSVNGEVLQKGILNKSKNVIDCSRFAKGIYILKLKSDSDSLIYKLMKE